MEIRSPPRMVPPVYFTHLRMNPELSEADLVRDAAHDEAVRQTLFLQSYDRLLRLIRRNLPLAIEHIVAAEDILQDTYVAAFQNFSHFRFQGPGSFVPEPTTSLVFSLSLLAVITQARG